MLSLRFSLELISFLPTSPLL